jgi:hypothetical protein
MPDTTTSAASPNAPSRPAITHMPGGPSIACVDSRATGQLDLLGVEVLIGVDETDRGARPAAIRVRCDDEHVEARRRERGREDVEALGLDAVVVRHQDAHVTPSFANRDAILAAVPCEG